jgi:Tfp pilus assembly PilM family ATPase
MQLRRSYFGIGIHGANEIQLSKSPWLKNGLRNKNELIEQIQEAMSSAMPHPINLTKAIAAVPEATVFSKVLTMPKLSPKELVQAIPYEAAEFLPLPLEEMYLDWQLGPRKAEKGEDEMHVFLVAAPKQLVDELTETLGKANVELLKLESEPFAVARSIDHRLSRDEVRMILNIDHKTTTCILLNQQTIKSTSTIAVGLKDLKTSPHGSIRTLNDELSEAISYYHNRLAETSEVKRIILTGEGALVKGLAHQLSKKSGLDCEVGYPCVHLPHNQPIHPRFNGAVGLALGKA